MTDTQQNAQSHDEEQAHETCPYPRATRGNVDVLLSIDRTTIERLAASPSDL
jgi:organic hydroperoxide reductase OsmC/OhrA